MKIVFCFPFFAKIFFLCKLDIYLYLGHLHLKVRSVSFHSFKVNAGCGGYLDKIYKVHFDILGLKAGFATFLVQKQ